MPNAMIAGLRPVHPGEVLREDVIPGSGLSKTAFAKRLGVSREALYNVLSGKSAVTPIFALKLGKMLDTTAESWLNMQQAYDLETIDPAKLAEIDAIERLQLT